LDGLSGTPHCRRGGEVEGGVGEDGVSEGGVDEGGVDEGGVDEGGVAEGGVDVSEVVGVAVTITTWVGEADRRVNTSYQPSVNDRVLNI